MNQLKRPFVKVIVGIVIAYPLIVAMAYVYGDDYVQFMTPLYAKTIEYVFDDYEVKDIGVVQQKSQKFIQAVFVNRKSRLIGGRVFPANVDITVSTLLGHSLQHLILIFTIVTVWLSARTWLWLYSLVLLSFTGIALLVVEMLDVPFVLGGASLDLIYFNMAPSLLDSSPTIAWMNFLNGGGRLALSITSAACAILLSQLFMRLKDTMLRLG